MGLKPIEFYAISPIEFSLMAEAYKNRTLTDFRLNRNIVFMMARLWGTNVPKDPAEFWDLGDKVESSDDDVAKLFDEIRKKQNG